MEREREGEKLQVELVHHVMQGKEKVGALYMYIYCRWRGYRHGGVLFTLLLYIHIKTYFFYNKK